MTSTETHPALQHKCPFCHADRGQSCRTRDKAGRPGGKEQPHPHSRRIALTRPAEERRRAPDVVALCCTCGQQRTVSSDYSRWRDPNHDMSAEGQAAGWRRTQGLKCGTCGERTRHAILSSTGGDYDETMQRYTLGGEWDDRYAPDRERLREKYFAQFPRNPNLKHRFYVDSATRAWDEGHREVTALCGAPRTIDTDPRTWSAARTNKIRAQHDGYVVAEQLGDTEYEDPETGLWWVDMDCVDCCRVSNEQRVKEDRERLERYLLRFAAGLVRIQDPDVGGLLRHLERLYKESRGESS